MNRPTLMLPFYKVADQLMDGERTLKRTFQVMMKFALDHPAFVHHENDKRVVTTYVEYKAHCEKYAKSIEGLLSDCPKGSFVGLQLNNSPKWLYCFYGLLIAGYKPLMVNMMHKENEVARLLIEAGAKAIITEKKLNLEYKVININDINESDSLNSDEALWADEIAFCTSGTTGSSRIYVFNGENICHQIYSAVLMPYTSKTIMYPRSQGIINVLAFIPFSHIFGFIAVVLWFTFFGQKLCFPKDFSPKNIIKCCKEEKLTHIFGVPLFWDTIAKSFNAELKKMSKKKQDLINRAMLNNLEELTNAEAGIARLKIIKKAIQKKVLGKYVTYCISGGSVLSKETLRVINGLGYPLYNGFGMTEIGITSVELSPLVNVRLKNSVGPALYNIEYKIADDGEVLVKSPQIHCARLENGKRISSLVDNNGYFHTQDIGKLDEDGRLYILGKKKDVIIGPNGENIYPEQLEHIFDNLPFVNSVAVVGEKIDDKEYPILVLKIDDILNEQEKETLNKAISEANLNVASSSTIKDIYITRKPLPYNPSMKLMRFALINDMKQNKEDYSLFKLTKTVDYEGVSYEDIMTIVEDLLVIFSEVSGVDKANIAPRSHFIADLGGDSYTYMNLVGTIEERFDIAIDSEEFSILNTPEQFALYIKKQQK